MAHTSFGTAGGLWLWCPHRPVRLSEANDFCQGRLQYAVPLGEILLGEVRT